MASESNLACKTWILVKWEAFDVGAEIEPEVRCRFERGRWDEVEEDEELRSEVRFGDILILFGSEYTQNLGRTK